MIGSTSTLRRAHAGALVLIVALALPELVAAADSAFWDQWRGPHRDGSIEGVELPSDLGDLERTWRVELDKGYASPIVGADRVFVAETVDGKTETVRALALEDGRELWTASWPGEGSVPFFAARNGDWIRSTPAFDGETIYVGGMNELLVALDAATGEERWRVDFPSRFETRIPDFGLSSSPLVDGEFLYLQAANSIVKLNKRTGETVWRALQASGDMSTSGAFSSPVIEEIGGVRQLVVGTRHALHGIALDDGRELWMHEVPNFRGMNILTPTLHGSTVFTSSHREGTFLYSVEREGDGFAAAPVWRHKAQGYMSSPIVYDGHAYLHLGNGRLTCIDLATGSETWTSKPFGSYWSMTRSGDRILALDEDGTLLLLRANPERFELLDTLEVAEQPAWAHLALTSDGVFVRDLGGLTAFSWGAATSEAASPAGQ